MDFDMMDLRQRVHQLIYTEFIQSLLSILRKLDFTTAPTTDGNMVLSLYSVLEEEGRVKGEREGERGERREVGREKERCDIYVNWGCWFYVHINRMKKQQQLKEEEEEEEEEEEVIQLLHQILY